MQDSFPEVQKAFILYPVRNASAYRDNAEFLKTEEIDMMLLKNAFPFTYRIKDWELYQQQMYEGKNLPWDTDKNPHMQKIFIHGSEDIICPPAMSEDMINEFQNSSRYTIPGWHGTSRLDKEKFLALLDQYL